MRFFGRDLTLTARPVTSEARALVPVANSERALTPVGGRSDGGWLSIIREPFGGAWQRNVTLDRATVLTYHAVWSCVTLIAGDISKMRVKLVQRTPAGPSGIWLETENPAYSPVLRKPNDYQNRIQFWECWILSKLLNGNTYLLKQRDERGVVTRLYVLDPNRVRPMVAADGSIWYELDTDTLSGVNDVKVFAPAREIIHDRWNCLFHPLCGVSALTACGLSASQGIAMQRQSAWFFANNGMPGAILSAPGVIDEAVVTRLKATWEANYTGANVGRVAVLGDGLKYEKIPISAREQQMIEQQKWTAEVVCSVFHVPPYKIGIGQMPAYNNIQALNVEYYSQALQTIIEAAELCLDEGLEMGLNTGTEFDLDALLRMDTQALVLAEKDAVSAGIKAPNESRRRFDLPPVKGGDSPYLQQQNYSLEALAKRDAKDDPFAAAASASAQAGAPPAPQDQPQAEAQDVQAGYGDAAVERITADLAADLLRAADADRAAA